jgi:GWxTD domain-containing protein
MRRLLLLLLCLSFAPSLWAISAVFNYHIFFLPDESGQTISTAYLEAYWRIDPKTLHYHKDDGGRLWAMIRTDILCQTDTGIVLEKHFRVQTPPTDPAYTSTQELMDLQRFEIPPGKLKITIVLSEENIQGEAVFTDSLTVAIPDSPVFYSPPQLLDTVFSNPTQDKNIFSKNDFQQIPLYANFLDDNRKTLRYYTELYQPKPLPQEAYPLLQTVYITRKESGTRISRLTQKDSLGRQLVTPIYGSFSTAALATGNYYLNIELRDQQQQVLSAVQTFFQLINKTPEMPTAALPAADTTRKTTADSTKNEGITYLDLTTTFVGKFTLPQVRAILKMLLPVASPIEANAINGFLSKPDDMYMRYFIYNYFLQRNKQDPEKEWKTYADKVRTVNKLFGNTAKPGYETDRGFMYLKYGKPDERMVVENESGALPYELWEYYTIAKNNQQGILLFYRPGFMVNDYRLLHSTLIGETHNMNWRQELYPNGYTNNPASRAEQYLGDKR